MGKLRGVVAGLDMQVTILLVLLWNTQYGPLPPVDGIEPAPVQISQEDLTAASDRFRRFKNVMHMSHTRTHTRTHTHTRSHAAHTHRHTLMRVQTYAHSHMLAHTVNARWVFLCSWMYG